MRKKRKRSNAKIFSHIIVGLGAIGGLILARKVTHAFEEEKEGFEETYVDPKAKKNKKMNLQTLIAPLASPLRKPTPHGYFGARRPTDLSQPFDHSHQGVDLSGTAKEQIFAVGDGKIVDSNPGKGEIVRVLLLNDGRAVVYADLGQALVESGAILKAGDVVGLVRSNGFVHVAIRDSRYGKFLDPTGIIPYDSSSVPKRIV
jgi:murein DD-endopeptidase MepM/ murein hydrolase activator NlpD